MFVIILINRHLSELYFLKCILFHYSVLNEQKSLKNTKIKVEKSRKKLRYLFTYYCNISVFIKCKF